MTKNKKNLKKPNHGVKAGPVKQIKLKFLLLSTIAPDRITIYLRCLHVPGTQESYIDALRHSEKIPKNGGI